VSIAPVLVSIAPVLASIAPVLVSPILLEALFIAPVLVSPILLEALSLLVLVAVCVNDRIDGLFQYW